MGESNETVWNVDMEVNLFHAMRGHKPAGVNRHFQMLYIHERLSSACKKLSADDVWSHLSTLYDLQALNESEVLPFPNKSSDFDIPRDGYLAELSEKLFPRTPYISTPSGDTVKSESHTKSASKVSNKDSKTSSSSHHTSKSEHKSDHKSDHKSESKGSSSSKLDSRSSTPASRSEHKSSSSSKSSQPSLSSSTSEPSPKRGKRTRNVPSASASPATPTEPPAKRRR